MSQFFHLHPKNPQIRLINQSIDLLKKGSVMVYPTDSGYALGCLLEKKSAQERICQIRERTSDHHFTLVCRDLSEIALYAYLDNSAFRLIKNNTPGRYTFILKATKEVPRRLMNEKRKTIGLRVPSNDIALALLDALNEPLMSTTLILPGDDFAQFDPEQIKQKLGKKVDLIIDGGCIAEQPTTIIDLTDGNPVLVRAGGGDTSPFL
ncbi:threonylcarbamoyl-AMP synthase [Candidatus Williamhamiltonella defendens]|uniref:Threonylcarbamoyl-AMP synthase n=1 Tax=Candidatus Williamhamiltonella defendens TaxID=138072 RepID=A0A2D3T9S4_9ENTR|nr:L-threonylcarbamoyladenylate synthase [Candidatus Hamiltonella defensa]ASV34010.1 threonylcarbamoyl-AMP synthase [Candidatus Hamiltonella defensa]ATW30524.1 threonylcarbamoyl-AMP synthase [Candidatus Hamiltonella defensa]ATW32535.1 threonylcarbamoyl-AMP synthase [Candidatus Hamiltonella defensa]AWK16968.1 threonylcarbamoyl-AMP synthase [Candidatus Hamiltonella defensa]AYB49767.1 threonylcarbamoyl-AMP synthase [Candidatus Hamiltonella defensa]